MIRASPFLTLFFLAVAAGCGGGGSTSGTVTGGPPPGSGTPVLTAIQAPECIPDTAGAFVTQNVEPAVPLHPNMPNRGYFLVVRYLGEDAIAGAPAFDFGRFPADWPDAALRGQPVTGLTVPEPRAAWQRARTADATPATSSAFQLACRDAGSYLDTGTFPRRDVVGGGPHAIYGFSFNDPPPQPVFDALPATEFVLQASVEIPSFRTRIPSGATLTQPPIGQAALFAYFKDRTTGKAIGLLAALFDNRYAPGEAYVAYVGHDTQTPFVSSPLGAGTYLTPAADSLSFGGQPWAGLRPARMRLTQANFTRILADVNAFCRDRRALRGCDAPSAGADAYSASPLDYDITDFGLLHEVFPGIPSGDLAMGLHASSLGAWRSR